MKSLAKNEKAPRPAPSASVAAPQGACLVTATQHRLPRVPGHRGGAGGGSAGQPGAGQPRPRAQSPAGSL